MRILFTYFTFPPAANGVARFMGETTEALLKKGHEIEVIAGEVEKKKLERKGKLRVHRLPFYSIRSDADPEERAKKFLKYLIALHKRRPIDIMEAQGLIIEQSMPYTIALNLFSTMYNVPLVLRFHGMALTETQKSLSKNLFWRKLINVCQKGSEAMYDAKIPVEKIATQCNAINTERFRPGLGNKWLRSRIDASENCFVIGTASRIIGPLPLAPDQEDPTLEAKGILDLIKAFGNSLKDQKDVKLVIAAAPPPEDLQERFDRAKERIQELAKVMGIKDKVIVKEFQLEEMPLFYNGLDLFALPSHSEAFPMVLLEAAACKVPMVASSVGGIPELIVNGESGFLVEPEDTVKLGKTLRDIIKSPKKRESVANLALKEIQEKYDVDKMADKLIGLYNSVLEGKSKKKEKNHLDKFNSNGSKE